MKEIVRAMHAVATPSEANSLPEVFRVLNNFR